MYFFSRPDIVTLYLVVIDKDYSAVDEESPNDGHLLLSADGLLSAINEPRQTFDGKDLYLDVFTKAGALMRSLILNHPFYDGNKRVAVQAALVFLELNGYELIDSGKDLYMSRTETKLERLSLKIARGFIKSPASIGRDLKKYTRKHNRREWDELEPDECPRSAWPKILSRLFRA